MNYHHAYHAGNVGDVLKHVVLVGLLARLTQKDKPLFFLDTHAGCGRYDLSAARSRKSGEAARGIGRLTQAVALPPLATRYLSLLRGFDPANSEAIRHYPGSPRLAAMLLRATDRAALCELAPGEAAALRREFSADHRCAVHLRDGYEALGALLPPAERRGLVLIDPPYEDQERELLRVADALAAAQRRWPQGVFAAWYPVKQAATVTAFHAALLRHGVHKLLVTELLVHPADNDAGLNGSGLALLNPPFQLDADLAAELPPLHRVLSPTGAGGSRVEWLVPEAPTGTTG